MVAQVNISKMQQCELLQQKLQSVKDEQGLFGSIWNGVKEFTNLGLSESDCEDKLKEYNEGKISFEEAVSYIESFDKKQDTMSNLMVNTITGVASIALATVATAGGPIGWGVAALKGAPIGAALKAGLKVVDRATNDVEGDALDGKAIAKDAISGAVTGVVSSVSSGAGQYLKSGNFGMTVAKNAQCGAMCGAFAGSATYMTDVAFGDKEFNGGELIKETVLNAGVSTVSGAIVGAGNYGIKNSLLKGTSNAIKEGATASAGGSNEIIKAIANDSATSTGKKVVSTLEKQMLNI